MMTFEDLVEKRLRTFTKLMAVSPMILTFIVGEVEGLKAATTVAHVQE